MHSDNIEIDENAPEAYFTPADFDENGDLILVREDDRDFAPYGDEGDAAYEVARAEARYERWLGRS
jgi:hypothetical protein